MTSNPPGPSRPARTRWPRQKLEHCQAVALGYALESNSQAAYSSALQCYLNFCRVHEFPVEPTPETLSFFIVYESHYIKPQSIDSYLSGVVSQLEPFFPQVHANRKAIIVSRTLRGCKKLFSSEIHRKQPLYRDHLSLALSAYPIP
jgi:hypothetical protein